MTVKDLTDRLRKGDRRALARALTLVENRRPEAREILAAVFPDTGQATVIGLTGPPGVGKSTLADALAERARQRARRVAVLAVDPSSPFTGGALLGDRARMEAGNRDPGVFIRSMATRGHVGGLAPSAFEAIALIEAAKNDFIIVETIGAGQDEVEVAGAVGLTLVVLAPGLGDELQASKSGLLEIADIIVVNKADRDEADRLANDLSSSLTGRDEPPTIVRTVATNGQGVDDLLDRVYELDSHLEPPHDVRRRFVEGWLRRIILEEMQGSIPEKVWDESVRNVMTRKTDPFTAVEKILDSISGS